jgi:hypothetical protein
MTPDVLRRTREEIIQLLEQSRCRTCKQGWDGHFKTKSGHNFDTALDLVAEAILAFLEWKCKASPTSDSPQDCDMPFCGCNPYWQDALTSAQEAGWLPTREANALRADLARLEQANDVIIDGTRHNRDDLPMEYSILRADLRAVVEVLQEAVRVIERDREWRGHHENMLTRLRAALARPGVQAALKETR